MYTAFMPCVVCGGELPEGHRKLCSPLCTHLRRLKGPWHEERVCAHCGVGYVAVTPVQKFCSLLCQDRSRDRSARAPQPRPMKRAHSLVWSAMVRGKLERPTACEACGREARLDAHHEDYDKPLEVQWLCRSCHMAHHAAAA